MDHYHGSFENVTYPYTLLSHEADYDVCDTDFANGNYGASTVPQDGNTTYRHTFSNNQMISPSEPSLAQSSIWSRTSSQDSCQSLSSIATDIFTSDFNLNAEVQLFAEPDAYLGEATPFQTSPPSVYPVVPEHYRQQSFFDSNVPLYKSFDAVALSESAVPSEQLKIHGVWVKNRRENYAICLCGEPFHGKSASSNLMRHLREIREPRIPCAYCNVTSPRPHNLHQHCKKYHKDVTCTHCTAKEKKANQPFKCPMCNMTFLRQDDLNRHLEERHRSPHIGSESTTTSGRRRQ